MKKLLYLATALSCAAVLVFALWTPVAPSHAQGPEAPQAATQAGPPANAVLFTEGSLSGSCSIECNDGSTFETDADTVIECACDCASVCDGTCTATDGDTTRTCTDTN